METIYQCPVCRQKLEHINKSFVCNQKHSFDISREGYVNFLLANQKGTKNPGDTLSMVESRISFLEKGFYQPLSDKINAIISLLILNEHYEKPGLINILDVGCGTGFYSGELEKKLKDQAQLWGIDISKPAIQKASKKYPEIRFSLGSSFHLPFLDKSTDIQFSIFSPFDPKELLRVLKPGGKIVLVRPGSHHLKELGALIYGQFQLQGNSTNIFEGLEVSLSQEHQVSSEIKLENNKDLLNLVNMTPYQWHLNSENKARLAEINEFTVRVDFQVSVFEKKCN